MSERQDKADEIIGQVKLLLTQDEGAVLSMGATHALVNRYCAEFLKPKDELMGKWEDYQNRTIAYDGSVPGAMAKATFGMAQSLGVFNHRALEVLNILEKTSYPYILDEIGRLKEKYSGESHTAQDEAEIENY